MFKYQTKLIHHREFEGICFNLVTDKKFDFSKEDCVKEVRKEASLFASLYYHFAKTTIDELGEKGEELIKKVLTNFAQERARKMSQKAKRLGIEPVYENFMKVTDIPFRVPAWEIEEPPDGRCTYCPYAEVWNQKGTVGRELGFLYCNTVDPVIYNTYNPNLRHVKWTGNLCWDPPTPCDAILFFNGKQVYPSSK